MKTAEFVALCATKWAPIEITHYTPDKVVLHLPGYDKANQQWLFDRVKRWIEACVAMHYFSEDAVAIYKVDKGITIHFFGSK